MPVCQAGWTPKRASRPSVGASVPPVPAFAVPMIAMRLDAPNVVQVVVVDPTARYRLPSPMLQPLAAPASSLSELVFETARFVFTTGASNTTM